MDIFSIPGKNDAVFGQACTIADTHFPFAGMSLHLTKISLAHFSDLVGSRVSSGLLHYFWTRNAISGRVFSTSEQNIQGIKKGALFSPWQEYLQTHRDFLSSRLKFCPEAILRTLEPSESETWGAL